MGVPGVEHFHFGPKRPAAITSPLAPFIWMPGINMATKRWKNVWFMCPLVAASGNTTIAVIGEL